MMKYVERHIGIIVFFFLFFSISILAYNLYSIEKRLKEVDNLQYKLEQCEKHRTSGQNK
jgi:hypothetical protein